MYKLPTHVCNAYMHFQIKHLIYRYMHYTWNRFAVLLYQVYNYLWINNPIIINILTKDQQYSLVMLVGKTKGPWLGSNIFVMQKENWPSDFNYQYIRKNDVFTCHYFGGVKYPITFFLLTCMAWEYQRIEWIYERSGDTQCPFHTYSIVLRFYFPRLTYLHNENFIKVFTEPVIKSI